MENYQEELTIIADHNIHSVFFFFLQWHCHYQDEQKNVRTAVNTEPESETDSPTQNP